MNALHHSRLRRVTSAEILSAATLHCAATGRQPPTGCQRRQWEYSTSFSLELITLTLADHTTVDLVLKDLRWAALLPQAAEVRPRFLHLAERESSSYTGVLQQADLGTPELWAVSVSRDAPWLLLERVEGEKLCHTGELDAWTETASWLARFHGMDHAATAIGGLLLRHDRDYFDIWQHRLYDLSSKLDVPRQQQVRTIARSYELAARKLVEAPGVLIHGEFYPSNVIVRSSRGPRQRICPIDWESTAFGVPLLDLAALTAGGWSEAERRAIEDTYVSAAPTGYRRMSPHRLAELLSCCRLHLAVQWLTWSDGWTPPKDQTHDWLREAMSIVVQLGD